MSDEGFHEIQLNGKQLVFLFMAATVVAVVIFLCGVMVGRGVPTRAGAPSEVPQQASVDPTAAAQGAGSPYPVASSGTPLVASGETLTYPERLEESDLPGETLKPVAETAVATEAPPPVKPEPPRAVATPAAPPPVKPVAPPPATRPEAASAPVAVPVATTAAAPAAPPTGSGFVVQVAAVRRRADADRIAQRLSAKGYPSFVTTSGANFRVRVGRYDSRGEAEAVAGRLQREERYKPWITR